MFFGLVKASTCSHTGHYILLRWNIVFLTKGGGGSKFYWDHLNCNVYMAVMMYTKLYILSIDPPILRSLSCTQGLNKTGADEPTSMSLDCEIKTMQTQGEHVKSIQVVSWLAFETSLPFNPPACFWKLGWGLKQGEHANTMQVHWFPFEWRTSINLPAFDKGNLHNCSRTCKLCACSVLVGIWPKNPDNVPVLCLKCGMKTRKT